MPDHPLPDLSCDPDQIGRTGGRPRGAGSFTRLLGKALGSGWQKGGHGGTRARSTSGVPRGFRQRVIVKALVVKHGLKGGSGSGRATSRGGASLARHVRYLGRDGTSEKGERGQFYDREQEGLDARPLTKSWHDDRHHFRLIVSPEKGGEIADMTGYIRQVMGQVETDLSDKPGSLQWLAINHFNTDNPHAHVLIRGVKEEGAKVLVMPREYVSHGLRGRAEEVATELLGERSLEEVREARAKEIEAERWTSLDRAILRQIEAQSKGQEGRRAENQGGEGRLRIDIAPWLLAGVSNRERGLLINRLETLEKYGLAQRDRGSAWHLQPDFRQRLIALGARRDIIQQLYGKHGSEAGQIVPYGLTERLAGIVPEPVRGRVVDHGVVDEMTLERYLVVQDSGGQKHYAKVREGTAYESVGIDTEVELGGQTFERSSALKELTVVAGRDPDQFYSRERHRALLTERADLTTEQQADLLRMTERHVAYLGERANQGVERASNKGEPAQYRIDSDKIARQIVWLARPSTTDLRVLAGERFMGRSSDIGRATGRPAERDRGREDRDDLERG